MPGLALLGHLMDRVLLVLGKAADPRRPFLPRRAFGPAAGAALRRDGDQVPVDPQELSEALEKFSERDQPKAELVKLRYFIGLTTQEAAEVLGISVPTADRWWNYSRAWLAQEIENQRKQ